MSYMKDYLMDLEMADYINSLNTDCPHDNPSCKADPFCNEELLDVAFLNYEEDYPDFLDYPCLINTKNSMEYIPAWLKEYTPYIEAIIERFNREAPSDFAEGILRAGIIAFALRNADIVDERFWGMFLDSSTNIFLTLTKHCYRSILESMFAVKEVF